MGSDTDSVRHARVSGQAALRERLQTWFGVGQPGRSPTRAAVDGNPQCSSPQKSAVPGTNGAGLSIATSGRTLMRRAQRTCLAAVAAYVVGAPAEAAEGLRPDLQCLALTVYHESRGESEAGKLAVAHVVINRARDRRFPAQICDVVYQHAKSHPRACEFSWTCDSLGDRPMNLGAWRQSVRIARQAFFGLAEDPTGGALWYHADYVKPKWAARLGSPQQIGRHLFYRHSVDLAATRAVPDSTFAAGMPTEPGSPLPDATRDFLKRLRITMIHYAADPESRIVRINSAMYRQGDILSPDLTLASVTSHAVVLRYRDRWFRFVL